MQVLDRTFDRYVWALATGDDTRLQPASTKWAWSMPACVACQKKNEETIIERDEGHG
jgi:hypothetical protein